MGGYRKQLLMTLFLHCVHVALIAISGTVYSSYTNLASSQLWAGIYFSDAGRGRNKLCLEVPHIIPVHSYCFTHDSMKSEVKYCSCPLQVIEAKIQSLHRGSSVEPSRV